MGDWLMGVETEYAVRGRDRSSYGFYHQADELLDRAFDKLVSLPDFGSGGLFLENGSRLYIDSGNHPELSTPECTNPTDLVRYILAGEQIMVALAELSGRPPIKIYKHNQDYLSRLAWGCHESYLHRADPSTISSDVLSHLVTRIIFTGAGGFDVFRRGPDFLISPRISFLKRLVTENSTGTRGILHIKDEPHAKYGFHRFHLLCGESLSSELAIWLKLATTMLVVAMSDAGLHPGAGIELEEPLLAMARVSGDEIMDAELSLTSGKMLSALDIQRHYLAQARAHQHDDFMPGWAGEACDRWEETLALLAHGAEAVATKLDWAIKQKVFQQHALRRGFSAAKLNEWKLLLREVQASLAIAQQSSLPSASEVLDQRSSVGQTVETTLRKALGARFYRDELQAVLSLITELREIDVRFAELGDNGLFQQLDRAGVLTHHVTGVTNIKKAMTEPPSTGRARARGEAVRRCFAERERYRCDWQGIVDDHQQRFLDLSDPFVTKADWCAFPENESGFVRSFFDVVYHYGSAPGTGLQLNRRSG